MGRLFQTGADRVGRRGRECRSVLERGMMVGDCRDMVAGFGIKTAMGLTFCANLPGALCGGLFFASIVRHRCRNMAVRM